MSSTVLVKIDHKGNELLKDHRVITRQDADKLLAIVRERPDLVLDLGVGVEWEIYLSGFTVEVIDDSVMIDAFHAVYPNGIRTRAVYDEIWESLARYE